MTLAVSNRIITSPATFAERRGRLGFDVDHKVWGACSGCGDHLNSSHKQ